MNWLRWRVRAGLPVAIVCLWLAQPAPRSLWLGAAICVVGLAIRAAAAGELRKQQMLATSGIYAWTRNPLYLGSVILAAGICVAGRSLPAAILIAAYLAAFYPAVIRREAEELRRLFGDEYRDYAARVSIFLPWPGRGAGAPTEFSWSQYRENREYQAAVGTLVGFGLLVLRMLWRR